jgi:hypothetical protein
MKAAGYDCIVPILPSRQVAQEQNLAPGRLPALLMRHGSMEPRWLHRR